MKIKSATFIISNTDVGKCPSSHLHEFAFIGRSNVGKSSLINMLAGKKRLALTSRTPGKTRLINHFLINENWYLVDLPGYGYARLPKKQKAEIKRMIETYILNRENLYNLFVLIDARHLPQKRDLDFMKWVGLNNIPFSIIFTKIDKISKKVLAENLNKYKKNMLESWEEFPKHFLSSSVRKDGREEILRYIESIRKMRVDKDIF